MGGWFHFTLISNLVIEGDIKVDRLNITSFSIFFVVLGFELRAYTLSHSTNPFLWRVFFFFLR
jgi:hypothetical protein